MGVRLNVLQRLQDTLGSRLTDFQQQSGLGRKFMTVLLPLVLIPMIVMGAAAYVQASNIVRDQIENDLSGRVRDKLIDLTDWVSDRQEQINLDAAEEFIVDRVPQLLVRPDDDVGLELNIQRENALRNRLLNKRSTVAIPFDEYLIVKISNGEIIVSTQEAWEGEAIEAEIMSDLVLGDTNTYAVYEHPLFQISETEQFAILTYAPIVTNESGLNEIILVGLSTNSFKTDIIEDIQRKWLASTEEDPADLNAFIVLQPNIFLDINPDGTITVRRVNRNHPALANPNISSPRTREYNDIFGNSVIGSYTWLPEAGLGITLELPRDVYLSEINSFAPYSILLILLATLFTVIVVPFASNRLLRPLTNLTEFAQRMVQGDWEYRIPIESEDEVGILSDSLNMMAEEISESYRSLEERVSDRTRQLRIASQVARVVISSPSLADLLRRGVELIKSQFGYYHVSIFLIDEDGENARLSESSGEVGQALKARGHSLKVGGQSVIGWVTANNQPRIAYDVTQDPLHLANELLPETRSEAAVPLQVAGRVLGALDVQSTQPEAFSPQDIEILQTLADQFCAAIQNAQLAISSITAADRARLMSQVTQELSRQMTVEDVMQTTAKSLHRALGNPEIAVRLHRSEEESSFYTEHPTSSESE